MPPVQIPATSLALLPPKKSMGQAMLALPSDAQRLFVVAYCNPRNKRNATRAAELAGYSATSNHSLRNCAYALLREPRIIAAIQEENRHYLNVETQTAAVHAIGAVLEDENADPKLKTSVAFGALDRSGLGAKTEHVVTVQRTGKDDLQELLELAQRAGRQDLIEKYSRAAKAANVIDADFVEITPSPPAISSDPAPGFDPRSGLEDLLGEGS